MDLSVRSTFPEPDDLNELVRAYEQAFPEAESPLFFESALMRGDLRCLNKLLAALRGERGPLRLRELGGGVRLPPGAVI